MGVGDGETNSGPFDTFDIRRIVPGVGGLRGGYSPFSSKRAKVPQLVVRAVDAARYFAVKVPSTSIANSLINFVLCLMVPILRHTRSEAPCAVRREVENHLRLMVVRIFLLYLAQPLPYGEL